MRFLTMLGALVLWPYWHVPKAAAYLELEETGEGFDLKCMVCNTVVYHWDSKPTLTDIIEAAKQHKKHA